MDIIFVFVIVLGKVGVVVVWIFGLFVFQVVEKLVGFFLKKGCGLWQIVGVDGVLIDEVLVLFFVQGYSFIGEDVVEFQFYGSFVIMCVVLMEFGMIKGL